MKSVSPMDVVDEVVDDVEEDEESEDGGVDDIFGGGGHCQRVGSGSLYLARARPTMISAKYRLKEERRKVLKISVAKLKRIDDPESSLRRSVLINNTVRRLQREARDEKMQRQQTVSSPYHHLLRPLIAASTHDAHPSAPKGAAASPSPAPPLEAPELTLTLPDLSDALVDDDPMPPPPSRLSVDTLEPSEELDDSSDTLSTPSTSPAPLEPPSPDDACPPVSSPPPYLGFDSMDSSFPAADEPSDVFSTSTAGILGDEETPSRSLASGASATDSATCYAVSTTGASKLPCDALSDEEEREACGALVNCLDELVQVTSLCREEESLVSSEEAERRRRRLVAEEEDDEEEVEDVHSVLSQFYMPPTPRMLTSIDDGDEEEEDEQQRAVEVRVEEEVALAVEAAVAGVSCGREEEVALAVEAAVAGVSCGREDGDAGEAMVIASARQCGLPEPRSSLPTVCSTGAGLPEPRSSLPTVCSGGVGTMMVQEEESESSRKRKSSYSCEEDSLLLLDEFSEDMVALERESCAKRQRLSDEETSRQSNKKVSQQGRQRRVRSSSLRDADGDSESSQTTQFSCGHASIFGELQSVVFHSLIASLES